MTSILNIELNGEARSVQSGTLADLLEECGLSGRVATAVNEEFIPTGLRSQTHLKTGDRVEVLAPMQGG